MTKATMLRAVATLLCLLLLPLGSTVMMSTSASSASQIRVDKQNSQTQAKKKKARRVALLKAKQINRQRKWCHTHKGKWAKKNPVRYAKRCYPQVPQPKAPTPPKPAPSASPTAQPSATPTATPTPSATATPTSTPTPTTSPTSTPTSTTTPDPNPLADHSGTISGNQTWSASVVHRLTGSLTIPAGASLTIAPNAVVKAMAGTSITVKGTLNTQGTWSKTESPTNPVTFTSINDNTIGGTTGSGSPTTSAWVGIITDSAAAVAHLDGVVIRHAAVALDNKSGSDVRIRGLLRSDAMGVRGNDDWVDARWVDWGDVIEGPGPSPSNLGIKRNGASVTVVPWVGMATPPVPTGVTAQPAPNNLTCTDIVAYGLRYSGAAPQAPFPGDGYYGTDDAYGSDAAQEIKYVFDTMSGGSVSTKVVAVQYPALAVPETNSSIKYADFLTSFYIGGLRLVSAMRGELARCPNTKFVATGYSQGAAAIRMGMGTLEATDPLIPHIGGLLLQGDPGKPANTNERLFSGHAGDVYLTVGSATMKSRAGYLAEAFPGIYHALPGDLPAKTWNICHETDFVCTSGPGTKFSGHASLWYPVYTQGEVLAGAYQIGVAIANNHYPTY